MKKQSILLIIALFAVLSFAHKTDSLFVPPKPEKPLRYCESAEKWIEYATNNSKLVEITDMEGIRMDLRYATFNNVTGHDMLEAFVHLCGGHAELERVGTVHVLAEFAPGVCGACKMLLEDSPGIDFASFGSVIADGVKFRDAAAVCFVHGFQNFGFGV